MACYMGSGGYYDLFWPYCASLSLGSFWGIGYLLSQTSIQVLEGGHCIGRINVDVRYMQP